MKIKRCINLDWVQIHVREPNALDAEYFRTKGYYVKERDYGDEHFEEMFTIYDKDFPYIEVRRKPYSLRQNGGIFDVRDVHLRLSNRACYEWHAIDKLRSFLIAHSYTFKNVVRMDVCLDLQHFDGGDNPAVFIERYMKGEFSKINQPNIRAYGKDMWDGRLWNSLSWGSKSSNVYTKLYNKTLELKEGKDKFYIRDAWHSCGMNEQVHDVWRVEFTVKSQAKCWKKMEEYVDEDTGEMKWEDTYLTNKLTDYDTPDRLLFRFFMLADHYFHFKFVERTRNGSIKRKSECKDKMLFKMHHEEEAWKPIRVTEQKEPDRTIKLLIKKLGEMYKDPKYMDKVHAACHIIATQLKLDMRLDEFTKWLDDLPLSYGRM